MKDFKVKITFKNNKLLSAIENAGYDSVASFAKAVNYNINSMYKLVNMKQSPFTPKTNKPAKMVQDVCLFLGKTLNELFPEECMYNNKLNENVFECEVDSLDVNKFLSHTTFDDPFKLLHFKECVHLLGDAINTLPYVEQLVVVSRFGIDCDQLSLEKTSEQLYDNPKVHNHSMSHMSKERVRQIENNGLKKLSKYFKSKLRNPDDMYNKMLD